MPNKSKQESYAWAFRRMQDAHEHCYFIEAAAIAESVISDRLHSFLKGKGKVFKWHGNVTDNPGFNQLLQAIDAYLDADAGFTAQELRQFQQARNTAIHRAAKSAPGTPTIDVDTFVDTAKTASAEGTRLARVVASWHRRQLRVHRTHASPARAKPTRKPRK